MYNIIINASTDKGRKAVKKISKILDKRGAEYKFHFTSYPKHAKEIAYELAESGEKNIIGVGGDGTFHEIINGVQNLSGVNLGFVAYGSGNDFAKAAGLPVNNLKKAFEIILNGKTKKIDYLQFKNGLRCLNAAGMGMDVEVLSKAYAWRRLKGWPNYLWAVIRVLKTFEGYNFTVEFDGEKKTYDCMMMCLSNGIYIGGGMKVSPNSVIDDGKLNLVVIKIVDRKLYKRLLPKFLTGKHIGLFADEYLVENVKITSNAPLKAQLDGEIYPDFEFNCRIVKSGINMFCM